MKIFRNWGGGGGTILGVPVIGAIVYWGSRAIPPNRGFAGLGFRVKGVSRSSGLRYEA